METFRHSLLEIEKIVNRGVEVVCCSLLVGITVLIFVQIIFRYLLQNSISWSEELARYMMIWTVFLAAGYVLSKGAHANIDMLINRFSPTMRMVLEKGSLLLIMAFAVIMIRYGLMLMRFGSRQISSALGVPMGYVYLAIPIGGVLLLFYCLALMYRPKEGCGAL